MGLQEKLYNATSVTYLVVLVWWIACLWRDEPGGESAAAVQVDAGKDASRDVS
jgi:hypothetical protein